MNCAATGILSTQISLNVLLVAFNPEWVYTVSVAGGKLYPILIFELV
ncbi:MULTISPECIES: hypothetical protein [Chitinophagaceae]